MCCFISQFLCFSEQDAVFNSVRRGKCGKRAGVFLLFFCLFHFGGALSLLGSEIIIAMRKRKMKSVSVLRFVLFLE